MEMSRRHMGYKEQPLDVYSKRIKQEAWWEVSRIYNEHRFRNGFYGRNQKKLEQAYKAFLKARERRETDERGGITEFSRIGYIESGILSPDYDSTDDDCVIGFLGELNIVSAKDDTVTDRNNSKKDIKKEPGTQSNTMAGQTSKTNDKNDLKYEFFSSFILLNKKKQELMDLKIKLMEKQLNL